MADRRGPTITAKFEDGPMSGTTLEVEVVQGRPPSTIDVEGPRRVATRYCLADWVQSGDSARYSFLYEV